MTTTESPWIEVDNGYSLTIDQGAIKARNAKGKELKSVPAAAKKTEEFAQLDNLLSWLETHDAESGSQVERWLLRSLPVPVKVVTAVWVDETWRSWLRDLVIRPVTADVSAGNDEQTGFLRDATQDDDGNPVVKIVNLDGETVTLDAEEILIPHPALLDDLTELREFAADLGVGQRFEQLNRAVHPLPDPLPEEHVTQLNDWPSVPAHSEGAARRTHPDTHPREHRHRRDRRRCHHTDTVVE